MELRSSRKNKEYKELQITLNGMGFYEEGMELQEMRQILNALQVSVTDGETSLLECDLQKALRESELDFMPSQSNMGLNSTMMTFSDHHNSSSCSSPELASQTIIVQVDVHHSMDWSPSHERLPPRKRFASTSSNADKNNDGSPEPQNLSDLLEPSPKRFHEICGPVSMRRLADSGVNMSNEDEIPSSSCNTSNENSKNSSNIKDGNSLENVLQFSTSSAAISDEFNVNVKNDDYEQSEPSM